MRLFVEINGHKTKPEMKILTNAWVQVERSKKKKKIEKTMQFSELKLMIATYGYRETKKTRRKTDASNEKIY